jgi:hypothetical protein
MRKREVASAGEAHVPGHGKDEGVAKSQDEAMRAKSAVAAAAKKHAESRRELSGFWRNLWKLYRRADDVVNMPFLIVFSSVLFGFVLLGSKPKPSKKITYGLAVDIGEGESKEWKWVQSQGKDVVGPVNCTTYIHAASETVVELGHGSGGGLAFKVGEKGKVKYVPIHREKHA